MAKKATNFDFDGFKPVDRIPTPIRKTKWTTLLLTMQESGEKIVAKEYEDARSAASAVLSLRNACKRYPDDFGSFEVVRRQNTVYVENKSA